MDMKRRALAEAIGTFWLVLAGCGSAVISSDLPNGIGMLGISFAFGLSLLTMIYAIGPISGCHLNPAVTVGLWAGGRFPAREIPFYVVAQVAGSIVAAVLLLFIVTGSPDYDGGAGLGANGYGEYSPGGYSLASCFVTEMVLTAGFLFVIFGATGNRGSKAAPIAIAMTLTLIHLISIPVTGTSVNPARSTGPALMVGGPAIDQLWLFWVAPLLGAAGGGLLYRHLFQKEAGRPESAVKADEAIVADPGR